MTQILNKDSVIGIKINIMIQSYSNQDRDLIWINSRISIARLKEKIKKESKTIMDLMMEWKKA